VQAWVNDFPPLNLWNWPSFNIGDLMHPLVPNLSELSNEDLHKKYNELMQKMNQAYRFGPTSVIPQMQMILENYKHEMDTRNRKVMEEMEAKADKFKGLIDIQK
jgi:hypothetical protein